MISHIRQNILSINKKKDGTNIIEQVRKSFLIFRKDQKFEKKNQYGTITTNNTSHIVTTKKIKLFIISNLTKEFILNTNYYPFFHINKG